MSSFKKPLTLVLANPRGFCAGVARAIQIVEKALEKFGAPVYVRHQIVHNRFVVESLERKGAIFVKELDEVPSGYPVIFSAHGVPKIVLQTAKARNLIYFDATCPLVSKVHKEVEHHHANGRTVILIGHAGHPEIVGTMGQVPPGSVILVEAIEDVAALLLSPELPLAYATQTTLSVDETAGIISALKEKFPHIIGPRKEDICYATTNRQRAIKAVASKEVDAMIILGAPNSSNTLRMVEVAKKEGVIKTLLVQRSTDLTKAWFEGISCLGLSSSASTPEILVEEVISFCKDHFEVTIKNETIVEEKISFSLPLSLRETDVLQPMRVR